MRNKYTIFMMCLTLYFPMLNLNAMDPEIAEQIENNDYPTLEQVTQFVDLISSGNQEQVRTLSSSFFPVPMLCSELKIFMEKLNYEFALLQNKKFPRLSQSDIHPKMWERFNAACSDYNKKNLNADLAAMPWVIDKNRRMYVAELEQWKDEAIKYCNLGIQIVNQAAHSFYPEQFPIKEETPEHDKS